MELSQYFLLAVFAAASTCCLCPHIAILPSLTPLTTLAHEPSLSYLLAFLPEGSGAADVQQLMQRLDPAVLRDIQG